MQVQNDAGLVETHENMHQGADKRCNLCVQALRKDFFFPQSNGEARETAHRLVGKSASRTFSTWQTDLQRKGAVPTVRCFGAVPRLCRTRGGAHQTGQQVKPPFSATYAVPTPGRCSSCGYKAQSQAALIKHIEVMHARATDLGLQCSSCDRQVWLLHRRGSLCTDTLYRCFQSQMDLQVSFSVALCLRWATPVPASHCTPIYP